MNNQVKEKQKELIDEFLDLFGKKRIYYLTEETKQKVKDIIVKIGKLELESLGEEIKNNTDIEVVEKEEIFSEDGVLKHKRFLDENNEVKETKPVIEIDIDHLNRNLAFQDPPEIVNFCKKLIKTIFHEIQHLRQDYMVDKKESSNKVMSITKDIIINSRKIDVYNDNYPTISFEKDAEIYGLEKYMYIMGNNEEMEKEATKQKIIFELGKYTINGVDFPKDDATEKITDELICEEQNKDLLVLYPFLQKEYNMDCTKKSSTDLVKNLQKEEYEIKNNKNLSKEEKSCLIKDAKDMYCELIYRRLEENDEEINKLRENIGKEKTNKILIEVLKYFKNEKQRKIKIINDNKEISRNLIEKELIVSNEEIEEYYDKRNRYIEKIYNNNKSVDTINKKNDFIDRIKVNKENLNSTFKNKENIDKDIEDIIL